LNKHYAEFGKEAPKLTSKPKALALAGFDRAPEIPTTAISVAVEPVRLANVKVVDIPQADDIPPSTEEIASIAREQYEVTVLGRV